MFVVDLLHVRSALSYSSSYIFAVALPHVRTRLPTFLRSPSYIIVVGCLPTLLKSLAKPLASIITKYEVVSACEKYPKSCHGTINPLTPNFYINRQERSIFIAFFLPECPSHR